MSWYLYFKYNPPCVEKKLHSFNPKRVDYLSPPPQQNCEEREKADGHEPQYFPSMLVLAFSGSAAIEPQLFVL